MKVLARRFMEEPAVALAILGAIVLAACEHLIGDGLTTSDLPTIAGIVGLGGAIRSQVAPAEGPTFDPDPGG